VLAHLCVKQSSFPAALVWSVESLICQDTVIWKMNYFIIILYWEYIVAFTKGLTIYHHSPLCPPKNEFIEKQKSLKK
jgi:hypothetical protein